MGGIIFEIGLSGQQVLFELVDIVFEIFLDSRSHECVNEEEAPSDGFCFFAVVSKRTVDVAFQVFHF